MPKSLFNVGIGLQDDNGVAYLSGTGAPGGDNSYQDAATIGSYYRDISNGNLWTKTSFSSPGSPSTDDWVLFDPDQLDAIQSFIGQDSPDEYWPSYGSPAPYHITEGTGNNLVTGLLNLDAAIGNNTWTQNDRSGSPTVFELNPSQSVHFNLEILDDVIGADAQMTSQNYIDPNISIYSNLSALDYAITAGNITQSSEDNVTAETTIDEVNAADVVAVKWFVYAEETASPGDPTQKEAAEIYAINDRNLADSPDVDATFVEYNIYSILKTGADITGLSASVDLSGAGASQTMRLRVSSTTPVNVRAARLQVLYA